MATRPEQPLENEEEVVLDFAQVLKEMEEEEEQKQKQEEQQQKKQDEQEQKEARQRYEWQNSLMGPSLYPLDSFPIKPLPRTLIERLPQKVNVQYFVWQRLDRMLLGIKLKPWSHFKGVVHSVYNPTVSPYFELIVPTCSPHHRKHPRLEDGDGADGSPLHAKHLAVGASPAKRRGRARKLDF